MMKDIFFIPGKPGLFRLISQGIKFTIVESLTDKKRIPFQRRNKIAMISDAYVNSTNNESETPVTEVLRSIKEKEKGKSVPIEVLKGGADELRTYFAEVLPDYDRKRVYPNEIMKILKWYNLLIDNGITDFSEKEAEESKVKE